MGSEGLANPEAKGAGGTAASREASDRSAGRTVAPPARGSSPGKRESFRAAFDGVWAGVRFPPGMFCAGRRGAPAPGAQIRPPTVGWRRPSRAGWGPDEEAKRKAWGSPADTGTAEARRR